MLIIPRREFLKMPAGTIFAPWIPNAFAYEFEIKVDGGDGEHYNGTMPLTPWLGDDIYPGQNDVDFKIYDGDQNDIRDYKWIAVLEEKDVRNLISKLEWALKGCPDEEEVDNGNN